MPVPIGQPPCGPNGLPLVQPPPGLPLVHQGSPMNRPPPPQGVSGTPAGIPVSIQPCHKTHCASVKGTLRPCVMTQLTQINANCVKGFKVSNLLFSPADVSSAEQPRRDVPGEPGAAAAHGERQPSGSSSQVARTAAAAAASAAQDARDGQERRRARIGPEEQVRFCLLIPIYKSHQCE